jgi:CYTH domain-containing protein
MIERERKFRPNPDSQHLARIAADSDISRVEIAQGYVIAAPSGEELRIRRMGDEFYLTVKKGSGARREEYESEIPAELFELLWPATEEARIEKTRFRVPASQFSTDDDLSRIELADDRLVVEIDRFSGAFEGFWLIEVEFPTEESAAEFAAPEWFGIEVTDDITYSNAYLARTQQIP